MFVRFFTASPKWVAAALLAALFLPGVRGNDALGWQEADDDAQQQAAERFLTVLERNPRRGTALDRLYGYYLEAGKLDELVARYHQRAMGPTPDAPAAMILGMLHAKRGDDAQAIAALERAEQLAPDSALASYYLGQALMLAGQADRAAEALERAIARQPARADLMEIFQTLGRLHQRAGRTQQAIDTWSRLEKLFPEDLTVQEQIAATLAQEEQLAEALPRYEALAAQAEDLYRRVQYRIEAGKLKLRMGQKAEAIADFEALLGQLKPESWLFRQVRDLIEESFGRDDDYGGLARYYETWLAAHADDVDAMTRLARTLAQQGLAAEAGQVLQRAVKFAPSQAPLRLALVDQFVAAGQYAEAAAQYELLDQADPNNPDYVRQWGLVILKDRSRDESQRRRAAAAVWQRLVVARPDDAVIAAQVADLLREAELKDEAIALYRRAIDLKPAEPQYREYLGQYYHQLGRRDDALATWREMAAGDRRTAESVGRLAEVLSGFGYSAEALQAAADAAGLAPKEYRIQLRYADLLLHGERWDDALAQLARTAALAESQEEKQGVLQRAIESYRALDRLEEVTDALAAELAAGGDVSVERWCRLAAFYVAGRQMPQAVDAVGKALALAPGDVEAWRLAADVYHDAGDLAAAVDAFEKLSQIDRTYQTQYLQEIARLQAQLGRPEEALQAGRELLAAAPGNPEHYRFFAELCFQLGRIDDGLDALRRAVRANPGEGEHLLALAGALARQYKTAEAIELYWQALEKADDLRDKLPVVSQLAELYLQLSQFDRLLERLERMRTQADRRREMTFCIAQAYLQAQDYATGRQELEKLLAENPRDTLLLQQLSTLAEQEADFDAAVGYQRQLCDAAPDDANRRRLAQLYLRAGQSEQSEALWSEMVLREDDPVEVFRAVDQLLAHERSATAAVILRQYLQKHPGDWEATYREGVALFQQKDVANARQRFDALMNLALPDDAESAAAIARKKQPAWRATARQGASAALTKPFPLRDRISAYYQIRQATGLETERYGMVSPGGSAMRQIWTPDDYGQARIAALAWLMRFARDEKKLNAFVRPYQEAIDAPEADPRKLVDALFVYMLDQRAGQTDTAFRVGQKMGRLGTPEGAWIHLFTLSMRPGNNRVFDLASDSQNSTAALPDDELDRLLASYALVRQQGDGWDRSTFPVLIMAELERGGRKEEGDRLLAEMVVSASQPDDFQLLSHLAGHRGDVEMLEQLIPRALEASANWPAQVPVSQIVGRAMTFAVPVLARNDRRDDILRLLDFYQKAKLAQQAAQPKPRRSSQQRGSGYVLVAAGGGLRSVQLDFPSPNDYYDESALGLLRSAYDVHSNGLAEHFRQRATQGTDEEQRLARLGLCYVQYWRGDHEQAAETLRQVIETADDPALRFDLATIYRASDDPYRAIAVLDGIAAADPTSFKDREQLALMLALQAGDVERARVAAERLFGMRLDSSESLTLAGQMQQLGLYELAESVLRRARRASGGNAQEMLAIMQAYQQRGELDVAVQIAHQILRRTSQPSAQPQQRNEEYLHQQALSLLGRSGKLGELIARTEAQLERSPESAVLIRALAQYYQAAGENEKARKVLEQLAASEPADARSRFALAGTLRQSGQHEAAAELYLKVLAEEPALVVQDWYQVQRLFQQAKKMKELATAIEQVDVSKAGDPWRFVDAVQYLLREQETRDTGMAVFDKLWRDLPGYRASMLQYLSQPDIAKNPKFYQYAREVALQDGAAMGGGDWTMLASSISWQSDGRVEGTAHHLLSAAEGAGKLDELRGELAQKAEKLPQARETKVLLAMIDLRRGQVESGKKLLDEGLADRSAVPHYAKMIVAQELEKYPQFLTLAIELYEESLQQVLESDQMQYGYGPGKRLVTIYKEQKQPEKARAILQRYLQPTAQSQHDPRYAAYQKVQTYLAVAEEFRGLDQPLDAILVLCALKQDVATLQQATNFGSRNTDQIDQQLAALAQLKPEAVLQNLCAIAASEAAAVDEENGESGGKRSRLAQLVFSQVGDLAAARLDSPLADAVERAAREDVAALAAAKERLQAAANARPDGVSLAAVQTLVELAGGSDESRREAVTRLATLAESHPLEPLVEDHRMTLRQRAAAEEQLLLWLPARRCLENDALRGAGESLAQRALEAARRLPDPNVRIALLREWGQLDLKRGDRAAAERRWREMLEAHLGRPVTPRDSSPSATTAPPQIAAPPLLSPAPKIRPLNGEMFFRIVTLTEMALKNDLPALAAEALREALRGGPPVGMPLTEELGSVFVRPSSGAYLAVATPSVAASSVSPNSIVQTLTRIDALWEEHGVSAGEAYEVLAAAVFPEGRPREILLGPAPISVNLLTEPESIGALLVRRAVAAKRMDDLAARIEARLENPLATVAGHVLQVQCYRAAGEGERAREGLDWLAQRLAKDTLRHSAELACHAALPALAEAELAPAAEAVLERAAGRLQTDGNDPVAAAILKLLWRRAYDAGDIALAARRLMAYYERARNDPSLSWSRNALPGQLREIGEELVRLGLWDDTLDWLGRIADVVPDPGDRSGYFASVPAEALAIHLLSLPPDERYRRLRQWVLPGDAHPALRTWNCFALQHVPPADFAAAGALVTSPLPAEAAGVVSFHEMLVEAARVCGKLDELAAEVRPLAERKSTAAAALLGLIDVARGDWQRARPAVETAIAQVEQNTPEQDQPGTLDLWPSILLMRAATAAKPLHGAGEALAWKLTDYAKRTRHRELHAQILRSLHQRALLRLGVAELAQPRGGGLAHWMASDQESAGRHRSGTGASWWTTRADTIAHLSGAEWDFLYLKFPLAGEFTISVDCYEYPWAEANVAYGGYTFEGLERSPHAKFWATGEPAERWRVNPWDNFDRFNRLSVEVGPKELRYCTNGHVVFKVSDPPAQFPFFALAAREERRTFWRNLQITGEPVIPREVRLVAGDHLEGWQAKFFGERIRSGSSVEVMAATIGYTAVPAASYATYAAPAYASAPYAVPVGSPQYDWLADDGVIVGRKVDPPGLAGRQSWLALDRPLDSGETLEYEFFYKPGEEEVHPAIGRLAMLLDPAGVRLHWITDSRGGELDGLAADNAADVPADRRGPSPLPLQPDQWNRMSVALEGDLVALRLNDAEIYRRTLHPEAPRRFGLFHDPSRSAVRVRNVVLRGNWPQRWTAELAANLLDRSEPDAENVARARQVLVPEVLFASGADAVFCRARTLPPAERFAYLLDWVLPPEAPGTIRLYCDFAPCDPAPPVGQEETGGAVRCPALELIRTAVELGRIDELAARAANPAVEAEYDVRCRAAWAALLAMGRGDDAAARGALEQLTALVEKIPPAAPAAQRWEGLMAGWAALDRPALRPAALALLARIVKLGLESGAPFDSSQGWGRTARYFLARARLLEMGIDPAGGERSAQPLKLWTLAEPNTAQFRGEGHPPATWIVRDGELLHYPGHANDHACFNIPLRGNFDLSCELTSFGWREMRLGYGGVSGCLLSPGNQFHVWKFHNFVRNVPLTSAVKDVGDWYDYRLSVRDGKVSCFAEGQPVYQYDLPPEHDPWVMAGCIYFVTAGVRNLRIEGTPTIPEAIDLTKPGDLSVWRDYFKEEYAPAPNWKQEGGAIVGPRRSDLGGLHQQSALFYHRPMAEDGSIEYDFLYRPDDRAEPASAGGAPTAATPPQGACLVHPALDRLALLLRPDGVAEHWITDGRFDRTGLAPDNATVAAENRRGPAALPLKPGEVNHLKLSLEGDTMRVELNGQLVYERKIEPGNRRTFGLYHDAAATEARATNVVYRGAWPRTLPAQSIPSD